MTEPTGQDLMTLATPYALHAVSPDEQAQIEQLLSESPPLISRAFSEEVRAVRETMAVVSASTAVEPPERLRSQLLAALPGVTPPVATRAPSRWRTVALAAAAALVVGLGAVSVGIVTRPEPAVSTAEQVFAAPDVETVSGDIPTGGTATVVFSRERNAGVLVMNNVAPPEAGYVYQMWLVGADGAQSAGTMDQAAVAPSTTAVLPDLGDSQALAFTVEPGTGSSQPTTPVFAELPLA